MTLILITSAIQVWKQLQPLNPLPLAEAAEGWGFHSRAIWFMMLLLEALLVSEVLCALLMDLSQAVS